MSPRKLVTFVCIIFNLVLHFTYTTTAQEGCVASPATGKTILGRLCEYWTQEGGIAQFGHPISDLIEETNAEGLSQKVQYFERAVLVLRPEMTPPDDVVIAPLGRLFFERRYPKGAPNEHPSDDPDALPFPQTGKVLGGRFLAYWQANGGIERQGVPLSNEFSELSPVDGRIYTVQYFENAVFELHTENTPPYEVLLSALGKQEYQEKYTTPHFGLLEDIALQLQSWLQNNYVKNLVVPIAFICLAVLFGVIPDLVKGTSKGPDKYRVWKEVALATGGNKYVSEDNQSLTDIRNKMDIVEVERMASFSLAHFSFIGLELGIGAIAVDIVALINRVSKAAVIGGMLVAHIVLLVSILLLVILCRRARPDQTTANRLRGFLAILLGFFSMMSAFIVI